MSDDKIIVGAIAGAFGVHGDVRLKSFCAEPQDIAQYSPLVTKSGQSFDQIQIKGQTKGALIAKIVGIATKEQADALKGTELFANRDQLPALPDDEFYYADLIGLSVHDTGGTLIGTVRSVQNHGATDLLEIHAKGEKNTILLPFTRENIPTVDVSAGKIVADPPSGLIE